MKPAVLVVDDDASILEGYRRVLGGHFELYLARGPFQGIEKLEGGPDYAVVVADMRMPEMNGIQFLKRVRARSPQTRRIMLSGDAEQSTAVDAVNLGQVSAFLSKPCPSARLLAAVQDAAKEWDQAQQERQALREAQLGALSALQSMLKAADAGLWRRGIRLRALAANVLKARGLSLGWQSEAAALLAVTGMLFVPAELRGKMEAGWILDPEEELALEGYLARGAEGMVAIPGFDTVAQAIAHQRRSFSEQGRGGLQGASLPLVSRVLHLCLDLDLFSAGAGWEHARGMLATRSERYDPELLQAVLDQGGPTALEGQLGTAVAA